MAARKTYASSRCSTGTSPRAVTARDDGVATAMWVCPQCGRTFANRNQSHACAPLGDLDRHFAGADPAVRAAFDRALAAVSGFGPVDVLAEKTRIALHVRMSFAAFMPRRHWLGRPPRAGLARRQPPLPAGRGIFPAQRGAHVPAQRTTR